MDISAFLWGVFESVVGNRADKILFGQKPSHLSFDSEPEATMPTPPTSEENDVRKFRTFDARYDIEKFASNLRSPLVHLLIEDRASTHYNLPGYVLESRETGEWFVFERGRLALQGSGGGLHNMADVVSILQSKSTNIVGWVIASEDLNALEGGLETWPNIKSRVIPLVSFHSEDPVWLGIRRQFDSFTSPKAS